MILSRIEYYENREREDYWQIKDVNLDRLNLVIGLNATGKTRLLNVISSLAQILSKRIIRNGNWNTQFLDQEHDDLYEYKLNISDKLIMSEEMKKNDDLVLKRQGEQAQIFSYTSKEMIGFSPPMNELTLHVRRDIKEYPFLERLFDWASNFHGYKFTEISPSQIAIPRSPDTYLENLGSTPYLLVEALKEKGLEEAIIEDFSTIGYPIEKITVEPEALPGFPGDFLLSSVKEKDLNCYTKQLLMSQGMYRAFSLIIIVEYLLSLRKESTVVIDDIGEGLDFDRSSKITKLIFDKTRNSTIQLIATSNDRFLINSVDIKLLNLLERKGHIVNSFNYVNSKDKFDAFVITGLTNFDFFSGQMYKDWSNN